MRTLCNNDGESRGFTNNEGGYMVRLLNKTGAASVKGMLVQASDTTDDAFDEIGADEPHPIGVVWESGVADGAYCWVVTHGRVQVLLEDLTTATRGYWTKVSDTQDGRIDATNAAPAGGTVNALEDHMTETGHSLQSVASGTDELCWIIFHTN